MTNRCRATAHAATSRRRINVSWSRLAALVVAAVVLSLMNVIGAAVAHASGSSCGATVNVIACENSQTSGVTPQSVWDTVGAGDSTIQGFGTDISVNAGNAISFKISTTLAYSINIYRLGYYGGSGARLWQGNLKHGAPVQQPACLTDPSTLLYDCGNWSASATWSVPSNAVSGVYIAHLVATNGDDSQITFIVRNDSSTSDIVYQTSDPTWEAYNTYGGSDFYQGTSQLSNSQARAFKISYNRPFSTRGDNQGRDFLFSNEYPTIRLLERNGYDVTYMAGVDTDRYGATLLPKHRVFMSVGHDEYWSQAQRTNVEHARDAGLNLMFLSGNEVFWHTRYEPSIDGTNTPYRTLVSYKETWDDAQTDPTGEATGTYRDPRFGTAPGGSYPENELTGTMYMANSDDLPLTVTQAQGKSRLWRNTGLSTMSTASTVLAQHIIGYESDEDLDNGFRPAGLVDLSTTTGSTPQYVQDFGKVVAPGTTTHHLTLYRAPSGALVFGAGTIQWGWGLDQHHDGTSPAPANARMQQATINMLADMHALPTTLMSGMVAPTASTDTQGPSTTIKAPAPGAAVANGTQVTVSGTAVDNGGGVVAGVEVSLDGGATWHPATGLTAWSYTGVLHGSGTVNVEARATDDSANTGPVATASLSVSCPCSLFGAKVPANPDSGDGSGVELGVKLTSDTDGYITGVRFYKASTNTGTHIGSLWTSSGSLLATGTFTNESASGWQTLQFQNAVAVTANTSYVVSYYAPSGHYSDDEMSFYYKTYDATPLHAVATMPGGVTPNGLYITGHHFPTSTYKATNYYVDATFVSNASVAPTVIAQTPASGASSIPVTVKPTASFSKSMNASTVAFNMVDANNSAVAGTTSYDPSSNTATFAPTTSLAAGTTYTITVTGSDTYGNALSTPATWNFRTAFAGQTGAGCPCSLFSDSTVPATPTENESASVELGIKFTSDTSGVVTGVRFYKGPLNVGSHTGTLWSSAGAQLATTTFANETTSGWQTALFTTPVAITAGTSYVVSYHTSVGYYSATEGAYTSAGLDNFPLHVPVKGGVYTYAAGFPSYASTTDYGVDVIFTVPTTTVPSVVSSDPSQGDTVAVSTTTLTATFNTGLIAGTESASLQSSSGAVTGTVALDSTQSIMTFTPGAPLTANMTYTFAISGGRSLSGTPMSSPYSITFTTQGGGACPCRLFASNAKPAVTDDGDSSAVTVGVKIVPAASGWLTTIRYYKAATNTGVHTGAVWDSAGNVLGTVPFGNETPSGWQSATLTAPIPLTGGSIYTVGYEAPNGHYSTTSQFFASDYVSGQLTAPGGGNGVYHYGASLGFPTSSYASTNYWVDATFTTSAPTDTTPPAVMAVTPGAGTSGVPLSVSPSATFSEQVAPTSIAFGLTGSDGTVISGSTQYNSGSATATFAPSAALSPAVTYTASVSAADLAGNVMPSPYTWTFATVLTAPTPGQCPCSVWPASATPQTVSDSDSHAIELGLAFSSDTNGQAVGARFYKGASNTGTHTATLWTSDGQQLATGTFVNESSTGWQTVTFASPVSITAGTTYVISYHTDTGRYSTTDGAFTSAGVDNAPLHVAVHASRYSYGAHAFPVTTSDTNYWVDPIFTD